MYTSARILPLSAQALKEHADACSGRGGGGRGGGEGSAGKGVAVEGGGGGRVWGGGGGRVWGKGAAQGLGLREERVEREGGVGEGGSDEVGLEGGRAVSIERGRAVSMKGGRAVTKFIGWGGADLVLGPDWVSTYEKMSIRFRPHHPHTSTLTDAQPPSHPFAPRQITVPQVYENTDVQTYISAYIFARSRARPRAHALSLTHTHAPGAVYCIYTTTQQDLALSAKHKYRKLIMHPDSCFLPSFATNKSSSSSSSSIPSTEASL